MVTNGNSSDTSTSTSISIIDLTTPSRPSVVTLNVGGVTYWVAISQQLQPLEPPTSFSGVQKINRFGVVSEVFNQLSWQAPTSPILGYQLRRNGYLIAILKPDAISYQDHNRNKNQADTYTLSSFNRAGTLSAPVAITVRRR